MYGNVLKAAGVLHTSVRDGCSMQRSTVGSGLLVWGHTARFLLWIYFKQRLEAQQHKIVVWYWQFEESSSIRRVAIVNN